MADETLPYLQERSRDPALLTWYRFIRVLRKILARMDATMQGLDVSRPQFDLLMQVAFEEGINQQTCAGRMNVTKGNVAQHIDRLARQGLIKRHKEGRTNTLFLTQAGKDLVASILPGHDRQIKEILSVLSTQELHQLQAILRKLDHGRP